MSHDIRGLRLLACIATHCPEAGYIEELALDHAILRVLARWLQGRFGSYPRDEHWHAIEFPKVSVAPSSRPMCMCRCNVTCRSSLSRARGPSRQGLPPRTHRVADGVVARRFRSPHGHTRAWSAQRSAGSPQHEQWVSCAYTGARNRRSNATRNIGASITRPSAAGAVSQAPAPRVMHSGTWALKNKPPPYFSRGSRAPQRQRV